MLKKLKVNLKKAIKLNNAQDIIRVFILVVILGAAGVFFYFNHPSVNASMSYFELREHQGTIAEYQQKIQTYAEHVLARLNNNNFSQIGNEEAKLSPKIVSYFEDKSLIFLSDLPPSIGAAITGANAEAGTFIPTIIKSQNQYALNSKGQLVLDQGMTIIKVLEKKMAKKDVKIPKSVKVAHILISYKGAQSADPTTTRTKDEAKALTNDILRKLKAGQKFEDLAAKYSDDPSNKNSGGVLESPVNGSGTYIVAFEQTALKLTAPGNLSDVTESPFGFHIIKALEITPEKSTKVDQAQYRLGRMYFAVEDDEWKSTGLTSKLMVKAEMQMLGPDKKTPAVVVTFNDEGKKLLQDITTRNIKNKVAIFVDGKIVSTPAVQAPITSGTAVIASGGAKPDQAQKMANDLTAHLGK